MRCLAALARWYELNNLCRVSWTRAHSTARLEMAPMVCCQSYHHELLEAHECCMKYKRTGKDAGLTQGLGSLLSCINSFKLSPPWTCICRSRITGSPDLKLAVPGTYKADTPVVTIGSFAPKLVFITSKQRPRKLSIHGSEPNILPKRFFVNSLQNTEVDDLSRVLWLKSRTSKVWLDRRTNYTRSLAVMSMVGYLLGLGDRHPSNFMLHRYSGKILHFDFGDCFEASMNREKFPEKVPFRLTRMLVKAMVVSGIEGNFRSTCENVMQVLHTNKDSVMAMMEHLCMIPLKNWRPFNINEVPQMTQSIVNGDDSSGSCKELMLQPQRNVRERELVQAVNQLCDANEVLNERAVVVMARMSNKLTGRDFYALPSSSVQSPVDHSTLIPGDTQS
ncbi:hypothetical protein CASFOL_036389 [Castilleja foliolosa]|uniref:PI3K/PI4K catalytic domain-containing protein n=1 Tax=Castilleja foliolosa TaxID=1961234 RepID=A0ABD3BW32_9LAMI